MVPSTISVKMSETQLNQGISSSLQKYHLTPPVILSDFEASGDRKTKQKRIKETFKTKFA